MVLTAASFLSIAQRLRRPEVEDGELEVKDDKGSYIVSNYLKNPETGNTLAKDLEGELKGLDKNKDAKKIKQINDKYIDLNEKLKDKKKEPDKYYVEVYMENGGRPLKSYEEFVAAYPKFDNTRMHTSHTSVTWYQVMT